MKKLCLVLILAILTSGAALAGTPATPIHECGGYTYIVLDDASAQIVYWQGQEAVLVIPSALDGRVVSSVSECAFCDCEALREVVLPETVVEIGEEAFSGCLSLERVSLPEGLRRIGDMAFMGCEGLTEIALPGSVEEIGRNPFWDCANLFSISVSPDSAWLATIDGALLCKGDGRLASYPMGLTAERYVVPEGVLSIGAGAFSDNLYLEEIVLPDSLVSIDPEAFCGCDGLRAIGLPAGLDAGDGGLLEAL